MKKSHFETTINALAAKVWDTMLSDETYRQWTRPFNDESHFEGSWEEGSEIRFVGSDGGMVSRIAENRPHEFISIEHFGIIHNGVEDTESEEAKKWVPAYENYALTEEDGVTTVSIDIGSDEQHEEMFAEVWPKALEKLKELCEK